MKPNALNLNKNLHVLYTRLTLVNHSSTRLVGPLSLMPHCMTNSRSVASTQTRAKSKPSHATQGFLMPDALLVSTLLISGLGDCLRTCYYYYYYKCHGLECCHHIVAGALYKNLDLKLLHSSMQTSADHQSRWHHVSRMTDEKGETRSPSGISKVRSRPESLVADCSMHVLQPPERHGHQA